MNHQIPSCQLDKLGEIVADSIGFRYKPSKRKELFRGIQDLACQQNTDNVQEFCSNLTQSSLTQRQLEVLTHYLTVGETYFFREPKSLEAFKNAALPEISKHGLKNNKTLKIWSAGCSSGEEPYTIAILLDQLLSDARKWHTSIQGTDINWEALNKARAGIYTPWSFRNTSEDLKNRYFQKITTKKYAINSRFKQNVSFSYLNLASSSYPSLLNNIHSMDIIFCRNVMIYLKPDVVQRILEGFYRSLRPGGWLIVAPSETYSLLDSQFSSISLGGATIYRKTPKKTPVFFHQNVIPEQNLSALSASWTPTILKTESVNTKCSIDSGGLKRQLDSDEVIPELDQLLEKVRDKVREGLYEEAARELESGISAYEAQDLSNPPVQAYAMMARISADKGQLDKAAQWCDKALKADECDAEIYYLYGMVLMEQGDLIRAAEEVKKALYLNPDYVAAIYSLANIAYEMENNDQALKYFQSAAQLLEKIPPEQGVPDLGDMSVARLLSTINAVIESLHRNKRSDDYKQA
ncbi:CheR family methyltransferase [Desulfonatronovibrio magnus]|uniref:CheR family methyltransferase n=1 Tax=Desulfonatronovibrio magnus TaxID=698827 RepID=UPI0006992214|nr:protein-glutamate O-methyltransferase CheR [Desulfonatronovibrio magnus]